MNYNWSEAFEQSKVSVDDGAGRSLCALQIAYYIICTCTLLINIIDSDIKLCLHSVQTVLFTAAYGSPDN